jgi:hypothetical protein
MLWKRFIVASDQRGLVTKNGRFGGILSPGQYAMFTPPGVSLELERHHLRDVVFRSRWADYLARKRPNLVERYFTCIKTNDVQVAMVYINGRLFDVLTPGKRMLFWRDTADIGFELVDVISTAVNAAEEALAAAPADHRVGRKLDVEQEAANCLLLVHSRLARARIPRSNGGAMTVREAELLSTTGQQLFREFGCRMRGSLANAALSLKAKRFDRLEAKDASGERLSSSIGTAKY